MTETAVKTYEVAGKTYELRELMFGQWQQLNDVMQQVVMPDTLTPHAIVAAIGSKLDLVLAVILTEQGQLPEDKDLPALAKLLAFRMPPEQVARVITDFFADAPVASVLNLVTGVTAALQQKLSLPTGSNKPSSCSPTETGPNATASSGVAPRGEPDPGSNTGN